MVKDSLIDLRLLVVSADILNFVQNSPEILVINT